MNKVFLGIVLLLLMFSSAHAARGLKNVKSEKDFSATVADLQMTLSNKSFRVFAVIDHSEGATTVDMELRPTTVIIFGNPKGGTPLMLKSQSAGLDLPLKYLVWQDEKGQVWISYRDPRCLARLNRISSKHPVIQKLIKVLPAIAIEAGKL